ncbi:riboflavin kinase / FMN adenylyltransferase [Rubrobacter xylanophilus DSM 9941]|uniref:Riboflavin biosynthesis protein n=1 Tax=Rubrobacter xylanophilus (strain DSM 9941 / JCM 11954 / NBRC 16129 / PRD-1) TaxID=266117 RepID=Q1AW50_RUBXD|nr:bifunctional riboflavin kinase/FAD synthetase [Rubrobacter xylanophilus]ABG04378.1 riboflavin kinase / FMN adenylyltransferase [Rubrobacter xylanophilus DSM 9941]
MRGVVVAIGNFDGVHLGHRAVLGRALEEGRARGMRVVAATFHPHPRAVLRPGEAPPLLTPLPVRRRIILGLGVDEVRIIRFDGKLSRKSPEEFVREVLVGELGAAVAVVGENFRFGHRAAGDFRELERLMRSFGGEAVAVPVRGLDGGEEVSSSRIRRLVLEGRVEEAARLLGRPHAVCGRVVEGEGRGSRIGYPTANVRPEEGVAVPGRGVYACTVRVGEGRYAACTNVGVAPTFGGRAESLVEAHLLDFEGDLYGLQIEVEFLRRIRGEKKFGGVEELREQIARDLLEARRITNATI